MCFSFALMLPGNLISKVTTCKHDYGILQVLQYLQQLGFFFWFKKTMVINILPKNGAFYLENLFGLKCNLQLLKAIKLYPH